MHSRHLEAVRLILGTNQEGLCSTRTRPLIARVKGDVIFRSDSENISSEFKLSLYLRGVIGKVNCRYDRASYRVTDFKNNLAKYLSACRNLY